MRTLVFGANGQLGRDLLKVFSHNGEVRGLDLPEVDVSDESAVQRAVHAFSPEIILNAAAFSQVEEAETNLEAAFLANETGARNIAELSAYHHIPVVYYSTSHVFDGAADTAYTPEDALSPQGVYARSKVAGEVATCRANPRSFILRSSWLFGPGGDNFVERLLQRDQRSVPLRVAEDEVGSPTHTLDLAEATLSLARTRAFGVYHAVNAGSCTRHAFAQAVLDAVGLEMKLQSCALTEIDEQGLHPAYSVLDSSTLEAVTGWTPRPWRKALTEYMQRRTVLCPA
jgi:dTDP-4-dehydrorhamnose reductase